MSQLDAESFYFAYIKEPSSRKEKFIEEYLENYYKDIRSKKVSDFPSSKSAYNSIFIRISLIFNFIFFHRFEMD